jgi:SAM-dependent methyltransferase
MAKRRRREWFDDDSFWEELYPFMFPEQRFTSTREQIEKVLALAKPVGNAALDLCCGPGRCSIALAQAGFRVTGVDRTKFLLDKARAKARVSRTRIEWLQMDMRDFVRADAYDLALSMFTSFGYFDDKNEDLRVLHNMLASLKPGGVCVVDAVGKELLAKIFQPVTVDVLPDGTKLVQRHEIFDDWTRIRNKWILIRKRKARSFSFHHTVYSGQELRDRMLQVGFADVRLYGDFAGEDYGPSAHRLIAVAHKAGQVKAKRHGVKTSKRRDELRA